MCHDYPRRKFHKKDIDWTFTIKSNMNIYDELYRRR